MHIWDNDGWYRRKWNIPDAEEWCEVRFLGPWLWFLQNVWIKAGSTRTAERYHDQHAPTKLEKKHRFVKSNAGMFLGAALFVWNGTGMG